MGRIRDRKKADPVYSSVYGIVLKKSSELVKQSKSDNPLSDLVDFYGAYLRRSEGKPNYKRPIAETDIFVSPTLKTTS